MSLGVEHIFLKAHFISFVAEQQIKVLQGFSEEERLHIVFWPSIQGRLNVPNTCIPISNFSVLFESLETENVRYLDLLGKIE